MVAFLWMSEFSLSVPPLVKLNFNDTIQFVYMCVCTCACARKSRGTTRGCFSVVFTMSVWITPLQDERTHLCWCECSTACLVTWAFLYLIILNCMLSLSPLPLLCTPVHVYLCIWKPEVNLMYLPLFKTFLSCNTS